ncbi:MAG: cell division protein ZipA [Gammaproteobacteria bacterium (ex Lamellibrachia satsuma)]|nr:MAG: cell division protein ZipA [Gammaproteobacteria bacterium (ex Lamellibrachia satsuma)]
MESGLLRLILLFLGIAFLVGIYLWDRTRRNRDSIQAKPRITPEMDIVSDDQDSEDTPWDLESRDSENIEQELEHLDTIVTDDRELPDGSAGETSFIKTNLPFVEQQELFSFSADEASPVDVPIKILQINLAAKRDDFSGPAIMEAAKASGLAVSEMKIFHRYTKDGSQKTLFNVVSMVEPGIFPIEKMDDFTTPGLMLFAQLPGPEDGLAVFSDMLFTAECLKETLGGELQDETHSSLTKQTIENMRSQILEHRRLIRLARSRG